MDRTDKNILAQLQLDGRLSVTELAERVGLSLSPCHRRLKALEDSGAIIGYKAQLNASSIGLNFAALVFVTLKEGDRTAVSQFENEVKDLPHVILAQRLFGEPDFLLHIVAKDLAAFQAYYDSTLSALPYVKKLTSTIVMKDIVVDRVLPM